MTEGVNERGKRRNNQKKVRLLLHSSKKGITFAAAFRDERETNGAIV